MRDDRFLAFTVGALITYAMAEMAIAYVREKRTRWAAWYQSFVGPFVKHPGRREWLRETLIREEMTMKVASNAD